MKKEMKIRMKELFRAMGKKTFLFPVLVLSFFLVNIFPSFGLPESDFDRANACYKTQDYQRAIVLYKKIIASGIESPEVYFNLGNCYFKCDSNAKAILYYEKALKLAPADEDIQFNLKVAGQRNIDKINAVPTLFINSWWNAFRSAKTPDQWAWLTVLCSLLSFLLFATFVAFKTSSIRRWGFWGGSFFLIVAVALFLIAEDQYTSHQKNSEAVIMVDAVNVKSSPEEKGKDIFILHSGTKLQIINSEGSWSEIRLPDNNVGWLPTATLDLI